MSMNEGGEDLGNALALLDQVDLTYRITRLKLRKGDKVVVKIDQPISSTQREKLVAVFERFIGPDYPVLFLEGGMELAILSEGR